MSNHAPPKFGQAFIDVLFLRFYSKDIHEMNIVSKVILYALAFIVFYLPILIFVILKCIEQHTLIAYFAIMTLIHVLARFLLINSKRIHKRFLIIKSSKLFLMRTYLIIEYIILMWLVYLFYPLACIFMPTALLTMSVESMIGSNVLLTLFTENAEQFILNGSIISYILFIFIDGFQKLKTGFLPDYLGLYAVLTVLSASVEKYVQRLLEHFNIDMSHVMVTLSRIFALSNDSMNIVASAMTLFFAIYSLYTSGIAPAEEGATEE